MSQKRPLGFDTIEENLRAWEREREKRTRLNSCNDIQSSSSSSSSSSISSGSFSRPTPRENNLFHHHHSHQYTGLHGESRCGCNQLLSSTLSSSQYLPPSSQTVPRMFQAPPQLQLQLPSLSQNQSTSWTSKRVPPTPFASWDTINPVTWVQPMTMSSFTSSVPLKSCLSSSGQIDSLMEQAVSPRTCPVIPLPSLIPKYTQTFQETQNQILLPQAKPQVSPQVHAKPQIQPQYQYQYQPQLPSQPPPPPPPPPPPQPHLKPQQSSHQSHTSKHLPGKRSAKTRVRSDLETLPNLLLRELISFVDPRDLPALAATCTTLHSAIATRTLRLTALDLRGGASPRFYTACRREYLSRRSVRLLCKDLMGRRSGRRRRNVRVLRVRPGADYGDKLSVAQIDADDHAVIELATKLPYVRFLTLDALDLTTIRFAQTMLGLLTKDSRVSLENISAPALTNLAPEPLLGKTLVKVSLRLAGPHMRAEDLTHLAEYMNDTAVPKLRDFGVMFDRAFILTCSEFVPAFAKLVESAVSRRKPPLASLRVYDFPPYLDFVPIIQLVEKYRVRALTLHTAAPDDDSRLLSSLAQLTTIDALRLVIGTCSVSFLHCPGPLWASLLHLSIDGPPTMMRVPARPFPMPCLHSLVAPAATAYSLLPHSVSPVLKELVVLNPAPGDPMPMMAGPLRRAKLNLAYFPIRIPHEYLPVKLMCTRSIPNRYMTSLPDSLRESALEDNDDYTLFLSHFYDTMDPDPPEIFYY
ncbi:uncharacterized protein SAPINGB_P003184 [Magnusiomyces paraingens]|uniref:F-box domain-containing protein n=1 Tax=Magnusiomyces paraingens TaxID=2606893 RepID=A0A5E8BKA6_9ASCO|nr:uncharacterized protein SAPINGB_P003184 [Saprochaete ingens]VVT51701.1 unnamed protein product [Saprochaete ingens]